MFHDYPYTDFHEINLDWLVKTMKEAKITADNAADLAKQIKEYVDTYFDNLDVTEIVNAKLDEWEKDGTLAEIINKQIFNELNNDITQLQGDISDLENEVATLNFSNLRGVKCLLIGNSYARGTGGTIGRGWPYYFQMTTGCDADIIQQSGGDFAALGSVNADYPGYNYAQAIADFASDLTADQKRAYRYVIVGGGYNDAVKDVTGSDIISGMEDFVSFTKATFPYANIVVIPLWSDAKFTTASYFGKLQGWANTASRMGCATTIDSIYWFYGDSDNTAGDSVHLNDSGYALCGRNMAAFVMGGAYHVPYGGTDCVLGEGVSAIGTGWRVSRGPEGVVTVTLHVNLPETVTNKTVIASIGQQFCPLNDLYFIAYSFSASNRVPVCICLTPGGSFLPRFLNGALPAGGTELHLQASWRIGFD